MASIIWRLVEDANTYDVIFTALFLQSWRITEDHKVISGGVTIHTARLRLAQATIRSPEEAQAAVAAMQSGLETAIHAVTTAEPDHLLIGVSALSFLNGLAGRQRFEEFLAKITAVPVTTASAAATAALQLYDIKKLALLSPHPAMMDEHYMRFFTEAGYQVARLHRIDCPTTLAIAMVDEATIRAALRDLCDANADAVVQLGTDLIMAELADEAERWLGKPVLAINGAMLWHALRARGIQDRVLGFGSILREH